MLEIEQGSPVEARVVIIFTGVQYRRLSVPGLDHFEGTSVFHAARGTTGRIALRCGSGVENDEEMAMAVT